MKVNAFTLLVILSAKSFAVDTFMCSHDEYTLKVTLNKKEDANVDIFLKDKKISSCQLEVVWYEENLNAASEFELTRFKKKSCSDIYDSIAKKVKIIDSGYFKRKIKDKQLGAYLVENVNPLRCRQ